MKATCKIDKDARDINLKVVMKVKVFMAVESLLWMVMYGVLLHLEEFMSTMDVFEVLKDDFRSLNDGG